VILRGIARSGRLIAARTTADVVKGDGCGDGAENLRMSWRCVTDQVERLPSLPVDINEQSRQRARAEDKECNTDEDSAVHVLFPFKCRLRVAGSDQPYAPISRTVGAYFLE
jgi:hypothetical protein